MGKKGMREKFRRFRRLLAVIMCVILATGTGVSSLAELGPLNIWIPLASDSNATAITDEEETEESRVVVASWSDATLSDATASDAVNWQAQLQARIDALPSIQEIQADETYQLLIDTYWEVLDIMDVLEDELGVGLYDLIMDADDGSIEGADELDVTMLYEVADYVTVAYASLEASDQLGELTIVADQMITIEPAGYEDEDQAILTLQITADPTIVSAGSEDADEYHEDDYYSYWTNETLELTYEISGGYPQYYIYRIYFKPVDAAGVYDSLIADGTLTDGIEDQIVFTLNSDGEVELGDYSAPMEWDEDEESWYVEFTGIDQQHTGGGSLQMTYPSPNTPGGDLMIYGVMYDATTKNIVSSNREAFDANWKTEPESFQVSIDLDETQAESGLILQTEEDSSVIHVAVKNNPDQDITYTISMEKTEDSLADENIGEDLIRYIKVTETITLPEGIRLNADVIPEPTISESGDEITFTSGGTILTLVNGSENDASDYSMTYSADTNTITLTWTIMNATLDEDTGLASSQIEDGIWTVELNGEYLVLDSEADFNAASSHEITNTVKYTYYYTWSAEQENEDAETIAIAEPSSNVVLEKTTDRDDQVYMGEDASYTVSIYNQGVYATTNLDTLSDTALDTTQYITPENIWKMFFGDEDDLAEDSYLAEDSGDYLTLTISGAMVYYSDPQTLTTVVGMDGEETVYQTNANYRINAWPEHDDAVITMVKSESGASIEVVLTDGGSKFDSYTASSAEALELYLQQIGYVVTASAKYSAVWDLSEHQLAAGETRHYKVYSTMKWTFQYWENVYLNVAESYNTADNTVSLIYDNEDKSETDEDYNETQTATADYTGIDVDFRLDKEIKEVDGETATDTDVFYKGSVVTYQLRVTHYGTGVAEDLPLVDTITGSQYLLAPVNDKNNASIANGDWYYSERIWNNYIVEYNGISYYRIYYSGNVDRTIYNVWLDDDHCAASVVFNNRYNTNNSTYPYYMTYTITWNYDTFESSTDTVTYSTLMASTTNVTSAQNTAYLNGRYNSSGGTRVSALMDQIDTTEIKSGSLGKQILTSDADADGDEESETYAYSSILDLNSENSYQTTVRYKLELKAKSGNSEITFGDVKDILPYTYGVFDWTEEQISVKYRYASSIYDSEGSEITPDETFTLCYTDEDGDDSTIIQDSSGNYVMENGEPAYQTMQWGDITLPANAQALWIYVELNFKMDSEEWADYVDAVSGNLKNILSAEIDGNTTPDTANVIHTVMKDAKAYLQKGVYWINSPNEATGISASDSREIYYNSYTYDEDGSATDGSLVAYYIQLYNASSAYLYLTEIQDLVPDGFNLVKLYSGTDTYQKGNGETPSDGITTDTSSPASGMSGSDVTSVDNAPIWVEAVVTAETGSDGILRFTLKNDGTDGKLKEDETLGIENAYYLDEGEAVSFIAEFEVGDMSETETYATNTIAMPYVNLSGGSLSVAEVSGTAVDAVSSTEAEQNVGGCEILDETERLVAGFASVTSEIGEISQWFTSDVTVRRGEIIPGINKSLETNDTGGIYGNTEVDWTIEVSNDGTVPMWNYTIADVIDSPYLIQGEVTYEIYNKDNECVLMMSSSLPLFEIARSSDSEYTVIYYWGDVLDDNSETHPLSESCTFYPAIVRYEDDGWSGESSEIPVEVTIDTNSDGDDTISIDFSDSAFEIQPGGRGVLTIQTQTLGNVTASSGTYYNLATITPAQSYDDDLVTIGEAVSEAESSTGSPYVKSSDQVHVSNGYSTSAQKWIQSNDDENKVARSEEVNTNKVHYIDLVDEEETFRYTLEVTNSLKSEMTNLVIVDMLPQSDDYAPFTVQDDKTSRESEFQVDLLESDPGPAWSVIRGTKVDESKVELGEDQLALAALDTITDTSDIGEYTIHYSTYTDLGLGTTDSGKWDLDSEDDEGNPIWTDSSEGARAIRIEITEPIAVSEAVQVSFNARISADSEDIAEPGEIGWNSFAYKYTTASSASSTVSAIAEGDEGEAETEDETEAETATLWAAPRKVGCRIPGLPRLTKELSGVDDDSDIDDQTFRFLVHEGAQLEDVSYSGSDFETTLINALKNADPARGYFITEVTVSEGTSETVLLDPKGAFTYEAGSKYTVVELTNGSSKSGNELFVAQYMSVGSQTAQGDVITFTYSNSAVVSVNASNKGIEWALNLVKVDEDTEEPISGVVFGLYSSTKPEEGVYKALVDVYGNLLTTPSDAEKITIDGEDGNWYLIDVKTTDEDGSILWTGLADSVYYVKELKAADGYSLLTDPIRVDYWEQQDNGSSKSADGTYKIINMTVGNKAGYILPKTGGTGPLWFQLLGLLLMSMGVSLTYITRRKITSLRRTK